jgi:pyruvate dehydrogenase E2 component (dihydrolipoamide acetyltransferase)
LAKQLGVDVGEFTAGSSGDPIRESDIQGIAARAASGLKATSSHRRLIAERLTQSVQTIPTFSLFAEANAEKLIAAYERSKEPIYKGAGVKVTVTNLLLKVFAVALKKSPELNSVWHENSVRMMSSVDIGLAVDTSKGVTAPVLRNVDSLNLHTLAVQRAELVEKARRGRLSLTELEGGGATLSNLGMHRVDHFQAIVSPGQSSILAVGQIRKRPWVNDSVLGISLTVMLNLTVDHRVADGATAASFLEKIVDMIESSGPGLWNPQKDGDGTGTLHA